MSVTINVNGSERKIDADPETPLLWVLRDELGMTGTKFGCGVAQCGACTVHMDGYPIRSCQTLLEDAQGTTITTIEGIDGKAAAAVKAAWAELDVPQCGYCQSGQILAATALLAETPKPSDEDIDFAMDGNVCRCATYARIRKAIHVAADKMEA
ncbi:(2Fe-2S)-binding protein [Roseibium sp.]|uniref:(2Fe-2S)-binding protein n=1 Tax=Roseibium sp. TaxID=1936156 RepID=UPI003A972DB1